METPEEKYTDRLNKEVKDLVSKDWSWIEAIEEVALDFDLILVCNQGGSRIYETPEMGLINCWIDASDPDDNGFDDQIEWYTLGEA